MKRELGVFETAQILSGEYAPFNAVGVFLLSNGPSPARVKENLQRIQKRHPLLQMRIVKEKHSYFFVSDNTPEIPHVLIKRKNNDHWKSVAEEELNQKFDITKGPLMRCAQLAGDTAESSSEIILCFHHAIIDATSVYRIAHELLALCQTNRRESDKKDKVTLPLLPPEEELFPSAFKGVGGLWHILLFMTRQIIDEISYRHKTRGQQIPHIHERARCRILPTKLSEEVTQKIIRQCRKNRLSLTSFCSAAMLRAVSPLLFKNQLLPHRHVTFADLRPYLKPPISPEHLGSYHSLIRFSVPVNERQAFWQFAQHINHIIYTAAKRGDKFTSSLMSAKMMRMLIRSQKMRMGTSALSYLGIAPIQLRYDDIQIQSLHGFVSNFPIGPEFTATARLFNRHLYWDFLYLDSDMDQDKAQGVANEIMAIAKAAAKGNIPKRV